MSILVARLFLLLNQLESMGDPFSKGLERTRGIFSEIPVPINQPTHTNTIPTPAVGRRRVRCFFGSPIPPSQKLRSEYDAGNKQLRWWRCMRTAV